MTATTELAAGRELDALVAEKVMGCDVRGQACAIFVEGEWSIHTDSTPEGWMCYSGMEPVYMRHCLCDVYAQQDDHETEEKRALYAEIDAARAAKFQSDKARYGHASGCLGVVAHYSTDTAAAMELVTHCMDCPAIPEYKRQVGMDAFLHRDSWIWRVTLCAGTDAEAETLPLAICRAALKAVGA